MNYELDDIDRQTIEIAREAVRYDDEGDPVKDVATESDLMDAVRLLLAILDAEDPA
jgi:dTDP-glucose pyrophosphorylase